MNKNLFALAALASTMLASPAFAVTVDTPDSTGTVYIDGSVADRCLFTSPTAYIHLGELSTSGSDTAAGKLNSAVVDGQSANLTGWCNGTSAKMSVEADAIINTDYDSTVPNGFARVINYTATANANDVDASDSSTDEGSGQAMDVGIFTGTVKVTLSDSDAGGNLLIAGDYAGEVRVTLSPSITPPAE